MSKKVYLYKDIRVELGLDPGYTCDKDGNLVPYVPLEEKENKEHDDHEYTNSD